MPYLAQSTVPLFGKPAPVTAPTLPTYKKLSPEEQDRENINFLLNPNPNFSEVDTSAAEGAIRSGTPGSGFALNNKLRLRDSEKINRFQIGHGMLEPYSARAHQAALQTQVESARLNEIAAQGEQAREMLRLQEQGLAARQSDAQRAELERLVVAGDQAMQRLQLSESGENARLGQSIAGNLNLAGANNAAALERTVVGGAFDLASRAGASGGATGDGRVRYGTTGAGTSGLYPGSLGSSATKDWVAIGNPANIGTSMSGFPGPGAPPVNPPPVSLPSYSGGGSTVTTQAVGTVDRILRQYGLL